MKWKLLLYCNKARPILRKLDKYFLGSHTDGYYWKKGQTTPYSVNGKIVAECDFEIEEIKKANYDCILFTNTLDTENLINKSCIDYFKLEEYLKPNWNKEDDLQNLDTVGYVIYIKNLHIFDTPLELNNFLYEDDTEGHYGVWEVERTPANYTIIATDVKDIGGVYCCRGTYGRLLALSSHELCDILNGKKTIIVRKRISKEML